MRAWIIVSGLLLVLATGALVQAAVVTRGWIKPWVGRKVAHIGFGAAVLFSWTLFEVGPMARWHAALPSAAVAAYFLLIVSGVVRDPGTVQAGSRSGTAAGLLRGPIFYQMVFGILTVVFWRTSPVGMAALGFMTLGDGFAEVVGKTVSSPKLPWSPEKSIAGSLAALFMGWGGGLAGLWLLTNAGFLSVPIGDYFVPMAWVAVAGALVESLPFPEIDNATATLACVAVGYFVL